MTKVNVYQIDGSSKTKIDLPEVFNTPYRPDIIKKSFNILRSNKRQPYGPDPRAGAKHATQYIGKGHGMSRVPRINQDPRNRAALAPGVVGGRRAHPPKTEKIWKEKMNKKERKIAHNSAIASTTDKNLAEKRGHNFKKDITLPIVIENKFEKIKKTQDAVKIFKEIGIYDDVLRAKNGRHIRAGKGKMRGRKYKTPRSVLVVSTKDDVKKACRNLPGVDVASPEQIRVDYLAPGGTPGRLTVITEAALKKIGGEN
ncbi:MAG: 50S ribosomal protein L4 [Candidatus Thermoplasmatota archaeon]